MDLIFPDALWSWEDSASNRNEYKECFLSERGKDGRCVGLTTEPPDATSLEIWKSQPPETTRACPGLYRDCFNFITKFF